MLRHPKAADVNQAITLQVAENRHFAGRAPSQLVPSKHRAHELLPAAESPSASFGPGRLNGFKERMARNSAELLLKFVHESSAVQD